MPDSADSRTQGQRLARLRRLEAFLGAGFALSLIVWTALTHTGALDALDETLGAPVPALRSTLGQILEALALLTHPLVILTVIVGWALYSYKRRMRRLGLALALAALGIPAQVLLSWAMARPAPSPAFTDSVSAVVPTYPSAHVTAMTLAAWVLVTLIRAHRRGSSLVALGTVLGYGAVAGTAVEQWLLGLARPSDLIGGFLLGAAVANLALRVGGVESILAAWALRRRPREAPERRVAIIVNPTKVDDLSLLRRRVESEASAAHWQAPLWLETTPEDAGHEMTRRALAAGVDLVIVAGGDGTVRAVSSELATTSTPMALMPSGTGNLLARNLSIPLDADDALRLALTGDPVSVDIIECVHDGGRERFAVMAGMGLDAQIMESTDAGLKKVIRSGAYAVAAVQNAGLEPFSASVSLDGAEPREQQMVMALLGNVGTITAGVTLFPNASPRDGQVDLLLANPDRVVDWARLGAQVLTGQEMPGFTLARARRVRIEADSAVPFELDGDTAGTTRVLEARVLPEALRVIAPTP
ncbi:diacylglycerol kinase family protein [Actinomyces slackii]|uniref:Diacylglycerol kinase n=1 Tax=Actinomyces slackii TaxID=52774 RepID=A0A3S4SNG5_9ACTO|nr:diacylglycerol kinase family protein [Actinomyces slackii]VEG74101.1 Diacylglycerol kinase [Actinomyces slackii]